MLLKALPPLCPPLLLHQQHLQLIVCHEGCVQPAPPPRLAVQPPSRLLLGAQLPAQLLRSCGARALLVAAAQLLQRPGQQPADCMEREGEWAGHAGAASSGNQRQLSLEPAGTGRASLRRALCTYCSRRSTRAPTCLCEVVLQPRLQRRRRRFLSRVMHLLPVAQPRQQLAQALVAAGAQLVGVKPVGQLQNLHHLTHLRKREGGRGGGRSRGAGDGGWGTGC